MGLLSAAAIIEASTGIKRSLRFLHTFVTFNGQPLSVLNQPFSSPPISFRLVCIFGLEAGLKPWIRASSIQQTTGDSGYASHTRRNSHTPMKTIPSQQIHSADRESHLRQAQHQAYPTPQQAMIT